MNIKDLEREFLDKLIPTYEKGEAEAITRLMSETLIGKDVAKSDEPDEVTISLFQSALPRLLNREPVQYILQQAWFCNLKLKVTSDVLIPRPETEELVYNIQKKLKKQHSRILDIGTGSGCIAIALKSLLPEATVTGIDISEEAIVLSRMNALRLKLAVNFHQMDIFQYPEHTDFMHTYERFDVIVSNPPYIPASEKNGMDKNVTGHEPHLALFVDNNDPLLFYRQIAEFASIFLSNSGKLYFEVHHDKMNDVVNLLLEKKFSNVTGNSDISGNNRFVEAEWKIEEI